MAATESDGVERGDGDRLGGDGGACHSGGPYPGASSPPWAGDRRAGDKARLFQYVRHAPEGTPLSKIVADVFGGDVDAGDAEYQLARRFFARHSEFFKTDSRGGLTWIEPRLGLYGWLNLRPPYVERKTSGRRRGDGEADSVDVVDGVERGDADGAGDGGGQMYAKERVRQYLSHYLSVESDAVRRGLFNQFTKDVEGTADKWQVFERERGSGDDYLCLPYRTRYNDAGRATDIRTGFETALRTASRRHNDAVVLTLTTDPKAHDGLLEAIQSLSDNKGRLMSWLSTEYQLGYRPENLSVLEFTESGLPHYHVVLFGVVGDVSASEVKEKWRGYGQGWMVDHSTATNTHDAETWLLHDDDRGKVSLRQYLGKAIRELVDVANTDAADLRGRVENGEISAWRQALYWATERQYYTWSPSLKPSRGDDGDGLPHVSTWSFVGVAEYHEIPAHVRQAATFGDRPPPD